jgi:hypothetical protein
MHLRGISLSRNDVNQLTHVHENWYEYHGNLCYSKIYAETVRYFVKVKVKGKIFLVFFFNRAHAMKAY